MSPVYTLRDDPRRLTIAALPRNANASGWREGGEKELYDGRMLFLGVHHVAVICSDYRMSREFYVGTLGLPIVSEEYRMERDSHKLNLGLPDGTEIELFSFPSPPARVTRPEACGLRHLALRVADVDIAVRELSARGVVVEPVRVDLATGKRFTFFADPDGLPIELYAQR